MNRMYVITRRDLTKSQQAVQAGHALAEICLNWSAAKKWNNHTLIYLTVKDLSELESLKEQLEQLGHWCSGFCEPYYDNQLTAFAVCDNVQERLRFLPLM